MFVRTSCATPASLPPARRIIDGKRNPDLSDRPACAGIGKKPGLRLSQQLRAMLRLRSALVPACIPLQEGCRHIDKPIRTGAGPNAIGPVCQHDHSPYYCLTQCSFAVLWGKFRTFDAGCSLKSMCVRPPYTARAKVRG
jgi:hypothetical protein